MSTKTLRKRIALVAVASLGAALLSIAPANAATLAAGEVVNTDTDATAGICAAGADVTASATPRYISVGGKQAFTTTDDTGGATIAGNAVWESTALLASGVKKVSANVISSDRKYVALNEANSLSVMVVTGTGPITVTWDDDSAAVETYYFIAQASCASSYASSTSKAQLRDDTSAADSNVDEAGGATVGYATSGLQKSYLAVALNDAYGNDAATATSNIIAIVTGGCTASFTATDTSGTATIVGAGGTGMDDENLVILNDNTPRSCVVTVTFDGTVVATKTAKFLGDIATLTVDAASTQKYFAYGEAGSASETALNANGILYVAKDSAGNTINVAAPSISGGTAGFQQVSVADSGLYTAATATTNGFATLDVDASSVTIRGAGTYKLKVTRLSDGVAVYSDVQSAEINKSRYTYTASFDKASYVSGEIMILTISAKDSAGNVAYDGQTIGTNTIAVGGATQLSTIATTDTFLNGKKTYRFSAGATASGYGWSVDISSGSAQDQVTGTVQITQPAGGVSNADVLKAIVSLIASINKQIAALQKALLKK
jgi:hypothetical protein